MLQTLPILAETVHKNRVKPANGTLRKDSYMALCPALRLDLSSPVSILHLTQNAGKQLSLLDGDVRVSETWSWNILASVFINFSPTGGWLS